MNNQSFLGWLGFGGLIFGVSHFVYSSIGPGDTSFSSPATIPPFQGAEPVTTKTSQSLVIPPPSPAVHFQPTQSTVVGSNQDAVDFVNKCKEFVDSELTVRTDLVDSWLQKLNEFTIKSAVEVSDFFWPKSIFANISFATGQILTCV